MAGKPFGHINKGGFHRWLGKSQDAPITKADIAKGKAAGGHPAKMASFADSAQKGKFHHAGHRGHVARQYQATK